MKEIHVVAGIIYNQTQDQILIARRPDHLHQGGLWEFPGGKVIAGELPEKALARELHEELGILIRAAEPYYQVSHRYPDKAVFLDFWKVFSFEGEPCGNEGQKIDWVRLNDLPRYQFPAANMEVVKKIR